MKNKNVADLTQEDMLKERQQYHTYLDFKNNPKEIKDIKLQTSSILVLVPMVDEYMEVQDDLTGETKLIYKGNAAVAELEKEEFNEPLIVVAVGDSNPEGRIVNVLDRVLLQSKGLEYQRNFYYDNIMYGVIDVLDVAACVSQENVNRVTLEFKPPVDERVSANVEDN